MATDTTVRLSIEVPTEVNEKLARYLPWGTKADAIRSLLELFLRECVANEHAASLLMKGRYKLKELPPDIQNLNEKSS